MEARRTRRRLMSEINVVPFVDVMLVLVVIFMVTSPVVTQGVKVELPQADAEPVQDSEEVTLVVSVNAEGSYFISLGELNNENPEAVSLEEIADNVSKIRSQNPQVPVFLEADTAVDYGRVVSLMTTLANSGAPDFRLITEPPR